MASRTRAQPSRRKPAARPAPKRARKPPARAPRLEQRHLDLVGLALIACAVFFAFVVWLRWDGGRLGAGAVEGLRLLVGELHHVAPIALTAAGALLIMRPVLPAVKPIRAGGICLLLALALALAAGTAGLGPGGLRAGDFDPQFGREHGGVLGEALFYAISTLLGTVGAHIVAVFAFVAAVLILTGASIAGVVRATSESVTTSTRRVREGATEVTHAVRRRRVSDELDTLERQPARVSRPRLPDPEPLDELPVHEFWPEEPVGEPGEDPLELTAVAAEAPEADVLDDEPETVEQTLAEDEEQPGVEKVQPTQLDLTPQGRLRASVTDDPGFEWRLPPAGDLKRSSELANRPDTAGQEKVASALVEALGHFGVEAKVIGMVAGPHITRYELRLAPGTKVGKVAQLKDDLAYALAASDIRVLAPIPGKQAVGVEVPNARRRIVHLGDVLSAPPEGWSPLTVWLGKDVAGRAIGADLAKMPHLLVAGTTGAGKSGCVNAMLSSILLHATPHEVRMVLVDPKQVELNHYESIPHLLTPVITSPRKAATALQNLVREMESRYSQMSLARTRSLVELNKVRAGRGEAPLPYILCVIDELADLMMVAPADVEDSIIRIAQKARAVGIHMVLATQSPRVDVITGMIKANVPSRIAFAVSSQTDSRVILDQNGAEGLLGQGDMLFSPVGSSRLQRIQGAYVDEEEILSLTDAWRRQGEPEFHEELLEEAEEEPAADAGADTDFDPDDDPLLEDAIRLVAEMQTASTSMLQRRLRLGYTRAGRLIDMLERRGVISGYEGSKPRQVLIGEGDVPRVLANLAEAGKLATGPRTVLEDPPADEPPA
ncbi:MAG TPA: DNA translocase FtsK [Solirubrobacteraceae bacterium]|nr:DNA translocase FtsK [Solirubrobacteraceae bacterium]